MPPVRFASKSVALLAATSTRQTTVYEPPVQVTVLVPAPTARTVAPLVVPVTMATPVLLLLHSQFSILCASP